MYTRIDGTNVDTIEENTTPGSLPSGSLGDIITFDESGDPIATSSGDVGVNSLEAVAGTSAAQFIGNLINIESPDSTRGLAGDQNGMISADSELGTATGITPEGLVFIDTTAGIANVISPAVAYAKLNEPLSSGGSVDPRTNGGRLVVTPAYMNTTSDSAFQANATDDRILFGWTQEVAHEISALSIYVTAVGTQGNITLGLYTADSDGEPDTLVFDIGTVDSGASADAWIRKTFTAQQLYPGKRYCIVASVAADKDVSFSYNRQDTGQLSGLVPGCWSKSTVNGGTAWTDLKKDSQPALLNIVLASTAGHVPQLVYGWTGKAGNKVALYGKMVSSPPSVTTVWELQTIPDEGVFCMQGNYDDGVLLGLGLVCIDGTLSLMDAASESSPTGFQDGVVVAESLHQARDLGLAVPVIRVGTALAPIRCDTYNTLWNADNQTEQVMFRQPHVSEASVSVGSSNRPFVWEKLSGNPLDLIILTGKEVVELVAVKPDPNVYGLGIGMDTMVAPFPVNSSPLTQSAANATQNPVCFCDVNIGEGLHTFFMMVAAPTGIAYLWKTYNDWGAPAVAVFSLHAKYMG